MRGFARTNRIGPLRFHHRRIHRSGNQKIDKVFSGDFKSCSQVAKMAKINKMGKSISVKLLKS